MSSSNSSTRGWGYRTLLLVFAGGVLAGLVAGEWIALPSAHAQIPDSGLQRMQTQKLAAETNRLLTEVVSVLRDGTLKVVVVEPDKSSSGRVGKTRVKR